MAVLCLRYYLLPPPAPRPFSATVMQHSSPTTNVRVVTRRPPSQDNSNSFWSNLLRRTRVTGRTKTLAACPQTKFLSHYVTTAPLVMDQLAPAACRSCATLRQTLIHRSLQWQIIKRVTRCTSMHCTLTGQRDSSLVLVMLSL